MNKSKNIIWICTIIILISAISIPNLTIKFALIIPSIIIALFVFYKNASQIVNLSQENVKVKLVKRLTIITLAFILSIFLIGMLSDGFKYKLSQNLILVLFTLYFIYFGNESPKIPCNRHLGVRLPWTINDEATWKYAHKIFGYISFPCSIIMFLVGTFYNFELGIILGIIPLIFIPSIMSYKFYKKSYLN